MALDFNHFHLYLFMKSIKLIVAYQCTELRTRHFFRCQWSYKHAHNICINRSNRSKFIWNKENSIVSVLNFIDKRFLRSFPEFASNYSIKPWPLKSLVTCWFTVIHPLLVGFLFPVPYISPWIDNFAVGKIQLGAAIVFWVNVLSTILFSSFDVNTIVRYLNQANKLKIPTDYVWI